MSSKSNRYWFVQLILYSRQLNIRFIQLNEYCNYNSCWKTVHDNSVWFVQTFSMPVDSDGNFSKASLSFRCASSYGIEKPYWLRPNYAKFLYLSTMRCGFTLLQVVSLNMFWLTVKPGEKYREIGNVIQKHAQAHGFSVVRSYCGHGIHQLFHTAPSIPHYASKSNHFVYNIEELLSFITRLHQ